LDRGDFTIYESNAIVEYLDEGVSRDAGQALFPGDVKHSRAAAADW